MKKILFVIQSLRIGGAERMQITLANKLVSVGYDVTVVAWKPFFDLKNDLDEKVKFKYVPPNQHLGARIPYIRHKFYDECMWELRATPRKLYNYYVKDKYDVEIAFFHGLAVTIVFGSTNKKSRKIAWIHHDLVQFEHKQENWDEYKAQFYRYDDIVCVSNSAKESFIKAVGDTGNITTIYNMLPAEQIRRKAEQDPPKKIKKSGFHMVLVGRFHKLKGYKRLFRVVSGMKLDGMDVSLTYVGGGEREPVDEYIRSLGSGEYITTVEGNDNPYMYMKGADLLVCASYTEGYNLTVAEAMILGIPVLSTDCSGPREILQDGEYGMLVENSEEGLDKGLRALYNDPELLEKYREKALERVDFFNEDKILKQITALFEKEDAPCTTDTSQSS